MLLEGKGFIFLLLLGFVWYQELKVNSLTQRTHKSTIAYKVANSIKWFVHRLNYQEHKSQTLDLLKWLGTFVLVHFVWSVSHWMMASVEVCSEADRSGIEELRNEDMTKWIAGDVYYQQYPVKIGMNLKSWSHGEMKIIINHDIAVENILDLPKFQTKRRWRKKKKCAIVF